MERLFLWCKTVSLLPDGATPHVAEGVAKAEQLVENAHQVLVVPFPIVQVAAQEFGHMVEECLVPVGRVASDPFDQLHIVIALLMLDKKWQIRKYRYDKKKVYIKND
jgi:hypothetical protein